MTNRVLKGMSPLDPESDRRKALRRPIVETFSLFVVLPKKGEGKLTLNDLSELGMGFNLEASGEPAGGFTVAVSDVLDVHLYLNQTLFIPLQLKVARVLESPEGRKVGGEYIDKTSKAYHALLSFVRMLDSVIEVGQLKEAPKA